MYRHEVEYHPRMHACGNGPINLAVDLLAADQLGDPGGHRALQQPRVPEGWVSEEES